MLATLLLFCVLFFLSACGGVLGDGNGAARNSAAGKAAAGKADRGTAKITAKQTISKQDDGTAAFVQRAGSGNVADNSTYIDDPAANGNPDAILFVTQVRLPSGDTVDNARSIGVWYDANRKKWAVFNQDRAPMPEGAAFNVAVAPKPAKTSDAAKTDGSVFVQRAGSENVMDNSTYIDDPLTNGNPDAVLSITPNWNPGGQGGVYNNRPVGVWYDANRKKWAVFNQDRAPMPEGAAFNVAVSEEPAKTDASVLRSTPDKTVGDSTYIDDPASNGNPDAVLSVTPNWNPGGQGGVYNNRPVGVWYDANRGKWAVFNEDGAPMPEGAAFNVAEYSVGGKGAAKPEFAEKKSGGEMTGGKSEGQQATRELIEVNGKPQAVPKYRDFFSKGNPKTPKNLVPENSTAGAIPAVAPFNFGRDPGGPKDKTMYLTVPKIGLEDVAVFNSLSEEKLTKSTVHVPATGFPWQKGANTYIAGHRLGYPNTGSYYVFFNVPDLVKGDKITLKDSAGGTYTYRVFKKTVVGPKNVEVMNPVEGKSIVTLQTCTLPDYSKRIIVQGELVEKKSA